MNHKFKIKQRVAALCMAAMMCCSLFPAGVFAEAPRADADGTLIMEQDKEAVTDDSHQTEASDPDPGEESTPQSSEAAATSQSADEDAPVETSTGYTFDGAVLYTYRMHRLVPIWAARDCPLPRVKQKSAFLPGRMTSWKKARTVT